MLSNRIKKVRLEKGITLQKLGDAINLAPNTISQYENGKREPKLKTWKKMADYLGVSVAYLQGLTPDNELESLTKITLLQQDNFIKDYNNYIWEHNLNYRRLDSDILSDWVANVTRPSIDELKVIGKIRPTYDFEQLKELVKNNQLNKALPLPISPSIDWSKPNRYIENQEGHGIFDRDSDNDMKDEQALKQSLESEASNQSSTSDDSINRFTDLDAMSFDMLVGIYYYQGSNFDDVNVRLLEKMSDSCKKKILDDFVKFMAHEATNSHDGIPF